MSKSVNKAFSREISKNIRMVRFQSISIRVRQQSAIGGRENTLSDGIVYKIKRKRKLVLKTFRSIYSGSLSNEAKTEELNRKLSEGDKFEELTIDEW